MYERPLANVKVERGSTFTFSLDLPYIVSIYARKIYNRPFFLQISGSHTSVQYNTHLPPTLHSKLFLQVLSMVLYCLQL